MLLRLPCTPRQLRKRTPRIPERRMTRDTAVPRPHASGVVRGDRRHAGGVRGERVGVMESDRRPQPAEPVVVVAATCGQRTPVLPRGARRCASATGRFCYIARCSPLTRERAGRPTSCPACCLHVGRSTGWRDRNSSSTEPSPNRKGRVPEHTPSRGPSYSEQRGLRDHEARARTDRWQAEPRRSRPL